MDFDPTCWLTEILETFPGVFCFPKSRINENGGKTSCRTRVLTIYMAEPEIPAKNSNGSRHSMWAEASKNIDCDLWWYYFSADVNILYSESLSGDVGFNCSMFMTDWNFQPDGFCKWSFLFSFARDTYGHLFPVIVSYPPDCPLLPLLGEVSLRVKNCTLLFDVLPIINGNVCAQNMLECVMSFSFCSKRSSTDATSEIWACVVKLIGRKSHYKRCQI